LITFNNLSEDLPYKILKKYYDNALRSKQDQIQAISISSYSDSRKEVDARMVNLKIINEKEMIFFSNYNSPKSLQFESNNKILALIYWSSIDVQIRMRARIFKTSNKFSDEYFQNREIEKNALAISSQQSQEISSYNEVIQNHKNVLKNNDLTKRPNFWGGFSFIPHYFEFWEGHKSRLNKREIYELQNNIWSHAYLQP
tara:strand:+ start:187 stop:783 length:597 start_codon:yes stop_codon:yes gene_type:complete